VGYFYKFLETAQRKFAQSGHPAYVDTYIKRFDLGYTKSFDLGYTIKFCSKLHQKILPMMYSKVLTYDAQLSSDLSCTKRFDL
jgi:hypothetical protein